MSRESQAAVLTCLCLVSSRKATMLVDIREAQLVNPVITWRQRDNSTITRHPSVIPSNPRMLTIDHMMAQGCDLSASGGVRA